MDALLSSVRFGETGHAVLLDHAGTSLVHGDPGEPVGADFSALPAFRAAVARRGGGDGGRGRARPPPAVRLPSDRQPGHGRRQAPRRADRDGPGRGVRPDPHAAPQHADRRRRAGAAVAAAGPVPRAAHDQAPRRPARRRRARARRRPDRPGPRRRPPRRVRPLRRGVQRDGPRPPGARPRQADLRPLRHDAGLREAPEERRGHARRRTQAGARCSSPTSATSRRYRSR